jgi:hypothetical protein
VWALGVILYECIAGTRPFAGDTTAVLFHQIGAAEPTALRARARGVPRDLETIVSKCLAKEPEHRYPTAAELAADLERFGRGEPIAARPVGPVERAARWVRRKPTAAAAYGFSALAVLLAAVVVVVFGFWREAEDARGAAEGAKRAAEDASVQLDAAKRAAEAARDEARRQEGKATAGQVEEARLRAEAESERAKARELQGVAERAKEEEAEARTAAERAKGVATRARDTAERGREKVAAIEYGRTVETAQQAWRDNDLLRARALLDDTDPGLRGWEYRYVHRLCNGSLLTLKGHTGPVFSASFSPDGALVVTAGQDKTAKVWDARTGAELLTLKGHTGSVLSASFGADGSRIVTAGEDRTVRVWDATPLDREFLPKE